MAWPIQWLENYLREARVLHQITPPTGGGGHAAKAGFALEGGVQVLAKLQIGPANIHDIVSAEGAAWVVARALGWTDLMPVTVVREVPFEQTTIRAAVQTIWPECLPDEPIDGFSEDELFQAAIFDAVIDQADRSSHNWLGVPGADGSTRCLKLVDHGYAFGVEGRPFQSCFYDRMQGRPLLPEQVDALRRLSGCADLALGPYLDPDPLRNLVQRAEDLANRGILQR